MIERIPSTEKILGIVWIVSWVLAIWIYHIQFFITGLFCLFLIFILIGRFDKKEEEEEINPKQLAVFAMDKSSKTLTVQKIYEDNIKWNEHEVCSGDASLPSGVLKEGDVVINCKGNVALRHIPSNTLLGGFDFEK